MGKLGNGQTSGTYKTPQLVIGGKDWTTADTLSPDVTIKSAQSSPTNASTLNISVEFSETVSNFTLADISLVGGVASNFTVVGGTTKSSKYSFDVTPSGSLVTINISASVAQDEAGNNNTAAEQLQIITDTVAPTGTITLADGEDYYNVSSYPKITLTASSDTSHYRLCLSSDCSSEVRSWTSYTANPESYDFASDGSHTLYVQFKDAVGNVSTSYSDSVTINRTLPILNIANEGYINSSNDSTYLVTGECSISGATVNITGAASGSATCNGTNYTALIDYSSQADGLNYINVTADLDTGAANPRPRTSIVTLSKDTVAPIVEAGADASVSAIHAQDGSVFDAMSGVDTIKWSTISGPGLATISAEGAEDTNLSANGNGLYVFRLTATDAAGNSAWDEMNFTWNVVGPPAPGAIATFETLPGWTREGISMSWDASSDATGYIIYRQKVVMVISPGYQQVV